MSAERGTPKGELIGLARAIKNTVVGMFGDEPIPSDQWEEYNRKQEELERRLQNNDFPSNAEAEFAYFPYTREKWLAMHEALDRMDKPGYLQDILGDSMTPEQIAYFKEWQEAEEADLMRIMEGPIERFLMKLVQEWRNPTPPKVDL